MEFLFKDLNIHIYLKFKFRILNNEQRFSRVALFLNHKGWTSQSKDRNRQLATIIIMNIPKYAGSFSFNVNVLRFFSIHSSLLEIGIHEKMVHHKRSHLKYNNVIAIFSFFSPSNKKEVEDKK